MNPKSVGTVVFLLFNATLALSQGEQSGRMPDVRVGTQLPPFPKDRVVSDPQSELLMTPSVPMAVPGLPPPELIDVYREAMPSAAEAARKVRNAERLIATHRPDSPFSGPLIAILIGLLVTLSLGVGALVALAKKPR
jgi:hypothetical protein